jgi:YidC/Oxa1 family membrane protein insertase
MSSFLEILFNLASSVGLPYYGVAIILFTTLIKMLLYPLTLMQMKSSRRMMEVQPKLLELQQKFKNNKEKLQAEMMKLYQKEGVNPYAGCLPVLPQLPILWIFYRMLLTHAYGDTPSALFLGFHVAKIYPIMEQINTGQIYYLLLPGLCAATAFASARITMAINKRPEPEKKKKTNQPAAPNQAESMQKMMLIMMPVMMGFIAQTVPAGLGLYLITMSAVSTIQTYYIYRKLDKEKAKENEIKEIKAIREKDKETNKEKDKESVKGKNKEKVELSKEAKP